LVSNSLSFGLVLFFSLLFCHWFLPDAFAIRRISIDSVSLLVSIAMLSIKVAAHEIDVVFIHPRSAICSKVTDVDFPFAGTYVHFSSVAIYICFQLPLDI
jgi:hypothetical protein